MEDLNVAGCGFQARKMYGANWAVTTVNTDDGDDGYVEAYWRIFKYINKANSQGVRLAKKGFSIWSSFLNEDHEIIGGQLAFYIPNAHQANPPAPTDDQVEVERWDDVTTYNRAFGGNREHDVKHLRRQYKYLKAALKKQNITPYEYTRMGYFHMGHGCRKYRNEVLMLKDGPM